MFPPNLPLLEEVTRTWRRGEEIRARRRRLMQHTYGDQWSDRTFTAEGLPVTEYDKAVMSGMRPLTNNLLRALVKSVVGRFRFNVSQAPQTSDAALRDFHSANFISELDARALEEYLISGCAIQKIVCEARPGRGMGVWTDNVSPGSFFCNQFHDPRGTDIRLLGMVHDMTIEEIKLRSATAPRAVAPPLNAPATNPAAHGARPSNRSAPPALSPHSFPRPKATRPASSA